MTWDTLSENLIGQFLIATPSLNDPNFSKTVTLICEHNESGSLGLIINRPIEGNLNQLLEELQISSDEQLESTPILQGGPVGTERGFVIHNQGAWKHTSQINDWINITTSKDILESISNGMGPDNCLLVLGYSGWGPGQLESEIRTNSWLSIPFSDEILFKTPFQDRWEKSIVSLGINAQNLSEEIGHA